MKPRQNTGTSSSIPERHTRNYSIYYILGEKKEEDRGDFG
jgi:hypothetical protein